MKEIVLRVEGSVGRLDRYLADECPELSRAMVQRLIKGGDISVNGAPTKASYYPAPGDLVRVRLPSLAPSQPAPESIPLRIIFEDHDLLVIDKPAGMVVHPGPGHPSGTLVNALLAHRSDLRRADLDPQRPGIVHRLDRDTSGLLVVAANRDTQLALQAQFKARQVFKAYLALVHGRLMPESGAIEAPIGRHPRNRRRMAVLSGGGRYARTEYRVREYVAGCTFVEAMPQTGRTHQLRVHFASIGHPVVGDGVYGRRRSATSPRRSETSPDFCEQRVAVTRQFLHAWQLSFVHPATGKNLEFTSELPADLARSLEELRAGG